MIRGIKKNAARTCLAAEHSAKHREVRLETGDEDRVNRPFAILSIWIPWRRP